MIVPILFYSGVTHIVVAVELHAVISGNNGIAVSIKLVRAMLVGMNIQPNLMVLRESMVHVLSHQQLWQQQHCE